MVFSRFRFWLLWLSINLSGGVIILSDGEWRIRQVPEAFRPRKNNRCYPLQVIVAINQNESIVQIMRYLQNMTMLFVMRAIQNNKTQC